MRGFITLLFLLPVLIFSLMAHELAHGYVALYFGDQTARRNERLSLNPLKHLDPLGTIMLLTVGIGWAKPVPIDPRYFENPRKGMAFVGLAGPSTNLVLAVVSAWLLKLTIGLQWNVVELLLMVTMQLNVVLFIFNLIPIPPLDGSRVVAGFLSFNAYRRYMSIERYGILILFGLILVFGAVFQSVLFVLVRLVYSGINLMVPGINLLNYL